MTDAFGIRRAGAADVDAVTAVIATAFHPLPPAVWLIPDSEEREKVFADYFRIFVGHAAEYGEIYTTTDGASVAVWFPASAEPAPPPPAYDERLAALCGDHLPRFRVFDELMDANHPHDEHDYLAFLATVPQCQDQGRGSALLRHRHAVLDERGVPAYLEASSPDSRELYLRHGYRPRGPAYQLPDGPQMWPMWREPGAQ